MTPSSVFDTLLWPLITLSVHEREEHLARIGQELLAAIGFREDSEYPLDIDLDAMGA